MRNDITPMWRSTEVKARLMSLGYEGVVDSDWLIEANAVADEWAREITGQTWGRVSFQPSEIQIAEVDEATYRRSLSNYITDLINETTRRRRLAAELARYEAKEDARTQARLEARTQAEERAAVEAEARTQAEFEARKRAEEDRDEKAESADEQLRQRFRNG